MRKGYSSMHRGSIVVLLFLLGTTLLFSVPEVTNARSQIQISDIKDERISVLNLDRLRNRLWSPADYVMPRIQWRSWQTEMPASRQLIAADIDPFGTPHAPVVIENNTDFDTQGWPGEGSVEQPYLISGLNINSTTVGVPAINITNTDVHFFIKDCWLTANATTVVYLESVSHARVKNSTILNSERGVVALHSDDLTVIDNLFYDFNWAGVYFEDCSSSTLVNNNCTACFVGIHIEQSVFTSIEDNYCEGCVGAIEVYLNCEDVTVNNNTALGYNYGIRFNFDCNNNIISNNNLSVGSIGILSEDCHDNEVINNFCRANDVDIMLGGCSSYTISQNNCGWGIGDMFGSIALVNSNSSYISGNYVENSFICIELKDNSSYNEVSSNTCKIYAGGVVSWYDAHHNTITNNTCQGQGIADVDIYLDNSLYCTVSKNTCNQSLYNILGLNSNYSEIIDNDCNLSGDFSIGFDSSANCLIEGNTITNGSVGIFAYACSYFSVLDNNVRNSTGSLTGIHLSDVHDSKVEGNHLTKCGDAIYVENSSKNNITDNTCIENLNGIVVEAFSYDIIIEDNYCHLQAGYAIVVFESFNCTVIRNTCTNTSGIEGVSLLLGDCEADALWNSFTLSSGGISVIGCDGVVSHNIVKENELFGIELSGIIGPNVTWNIFEDNGANAIDDSSTTVFMYNFWSNYSGVDANSDGFGDTWHPIVGLGNSNDTMPLVYHPTLPYWDPPDDFNLFSELGDEFEWMFGYAGLTIYAPIVDWRVNDTDFTIDDGTIRNAVFLNLGEYHLEVTAINLYGFELVGFFTLTVSDTLAPSVGGPDDFDYVVGQVGRNITWIAEDYDPASYSVNLDGVEVMSGMWNSTSESVTITADGLSIGDHTFVVTFIDGSGNSATDNVVVTVVPDNTPVILALAAGGVAAAVIIVIFLVRKKQPAE
ncbi:MAG: NosD domain-containing protein [Candidatus Thorarchaeota archaeon]